MRRLLLIVALLGSSLAHAEERVSIITLGGMAGGAGDAEEAAPLFGPRLSLGWEHAPLEMPPKPGYTFGVALVPELLAGALFHEESAEAFIGVGLRGEIRMAQREQGLLKVSARSSVYLAVRGIVIGENRVPLGELAFGQYLVIGRHRTRIGYELDALIHREPVYDRMETGREAAVVGGLFQLYVGWAL